MDQSLGNLEELVLLIVMNLEEAYGVTVAKEYEARSGNSISIPAVHTVLKRLEKKGMIESKLGAPTAERGGRSKRIYQATKFGYKVLTQLKDMRSSLWETIPKNLIWELK